VKYYEDLSVGGNFLEAVNRIYDVLRWAETKQDCTHVLIIDLVKLFPNSDSEHLPALYDRLFRAASGKAAS
jgi:hypothetical protein